MEFPEEDVYLSGREEIMGNSMTLEMSSIEIVWLTIGLINCR